MNELRGNVFTPEVIRGKNGKSAYEIAVENGFQGSEAQWIASMKPATKVVPLVVYDTACYLNGLDDLDIRSILSLYNDSTGGNEEMTLSLVTNGNGNVCVYNSPDGFAIDTWYDRFTVATTFLRFFTPSGIGAVVHQVLADGLVYPQEFGDETDVDIELTRDVEFILVEIY